MLRLALALLTISATGCGLYTGDDEPPPPCYPYAALSIAQEQRDPYTGTCNPGYYPCDDRCGPCPAYESADAIAPGPACYGACSGLDEQSCLASTECHAQYDVGGFIAGTVFNECWDIAPLPVTSGNACEGLDAWSCAMAEDCIGVFEVQHGPDDGILGRTFSYCAAQPVGGSCAAATCAPGTHCVEECVSACPDPGMGPGPEDPTCTTYCEARCIPDEPYSCAVIDCGPGYTCVEQCDSMDPTMGGPGYCYPACIPVPNHDPGECYAPVACDALPPACPTGTVAGVLNGCWSGYCIPEANCGPSDPGGCDPADGTCLVGPPMCPSGTIPGTSGGCYTGYCIPESSCPAVPCEALTDETTCLSRPECSAVYAGTNCTCLPDGSCTCESQEFSRCETWWL